MSSFRRRNVHKQFTRTSPQKGQVKTSSGNPSLDVLLGVSLAIGLICLIEENKFVATCSKVLANSLWPRVFYQSKRCLRSLDDSPKDVVEKLQKPLDDGKVDKGKMEYEENQEMAKYGLRIALRYNDLQMVNSEKTNEIND